MKRLLRRIALALLAVVVVVLGGGGIYACAQASSFDEAMEKVYDVPLPTVERSSDPDVLARGKHVAESIGACTAADCHGPDLGGGRVVKMGPLATVSAPNISQGGLGAAYSDAELARLLKHGVKKDGRSVRFMPVHESHYWLPDSDITALISYMRTLPAVDRPNGPIEIGLLGKVLDRRDAIVLDVARRIDHGKNVQIAPAPTAEYGSYLAKNCTGCHGEQLSGGRIPGTPSELPVPPNLTPHESGLKDWTYEDFEQLMRQGQRKSGKKLDPFMPLDAFGKMDDTEMKALWAYLRTVKPIAFGNR